MWFSEFAAKRGIDCQLFDISKTDSSIIESLDSDTLIGVISPVHGFNYPQITLDFINKLFLALRSRFGMQSVPAKSVVRLFVSNKNNPSLYFFIADQCPKVVEPKYQFALLHQETSTFSGIEKLAHSTGAIVVYIHVIKTDRSVYNAEYKMVCSDSKSAKATEITQKYIHLLEKNIQEQPSGWLWTHKRWKR